MELRNKCNPALPFFRGLPSRYSTKILIQVTNNSYKYNPFSHFKHSFKSETRLADMIENW
jgi:hypothetical protein